MALWKKALIWLAVSVAIVAGFFLIFVLTYVNIELPSVPSGKYVLTKITEFAGSSEDLVESFDDNSLYIEIKANSVLESHSGDKGIKQNEKGYNYFLNGDEVYVYDLENTEELAYGGFYASGTIKIFVQTQETTFYFYYCLS